MATSTTYNRAFWNVMKGKDENYQNLNEGEVNTFSDSLLSHF